MQRSFLLVLVAAMAMVGFIAPVAYAYNTGWSAATAPSGGCAKMAQQQTLTSSQTLPDVAYVASEQQLNQTILTLCVRFQGSIYQIDSYINTNQSQYWTAIENVGLTIKHDANNNAYFIVSWITCLVKDTYVEMYAHYKKSTDANTVDIGLFFRYNFDAPGTDFDPVSDFFLSRQSDCADCSDPWTTYGFPRTRYAVRLWFYDENHYAWSYGQTRFEPPPGVWGYWSYGAATAEYWQYLFVRSGGTVKRVSLVNAHWNEDRVCGNGYWSDEIDCLNYPCPVEFRYAPNPNDPYDDGNLSGVGCDAVAFRCRVDSDYLYVYRTDWAGRASVPDYTYWTWNRTFGIVATNCGTVHVLFPDLTNSGIRDVVVGPSCTFPSAVTYPPPYSGGHGEEILDVVPKQGTDREAFDILVSHNSEDEDGTVPSVTYVERVYDSANNGLGPSDGAPKIICESYSGNAQYQLGATRYGNLSYKNAAYVVGGMVKGDYVY